MRWKVPRADRRFTTTIQEARSTGLPLSSVQTERHWKYGKDQILYGRKLPSVRTQTPLLEVC